MAKTGRFLPVGYLGLGREWRICLISPRAGGRFSFYRVQKIKMRNLFASFGRFGERVRQGARAAARAIMEALRSILALIGRLLEASVRAVNTAVDSILKWCDCRSRIRSARNGILAGAAFRLFWQ
jgi:hypothetical protein